jgi:hypothetical protein
MLGALDAYKNEQANAAADVDPETMDMNTNMDMDMDAAMAQAHGHGQQPGQQSPSSQPTNPRGTGRNPAARHERTLNVADEDTDWEFCPQCHGLFEPDGEYEAHFESPDFNCHRNQNA